MPSGSRDSIFSNGSLLGIFGGVQGDHHKLASITAVLPAQDVKKARRVRKSPYKTKWLESHLIRPNGLEVKLAASFTNSPEAENTCSRQFLLSLTITLPLKKRDVLLVNWE